MLAQRLVLALIVRADALPVEALRRVQHLFERQLADALTVLDHERNVVGAYLECSARPDGSTTRVVSEARVEEPGVVRAQLPTRRVVRGHLRCERRRYA